MADVLDARGGPGHAVLVASAHTPDYLGPDGRPLDGVAVLDEHDDMRRHPVHLLTVRGGRVHVLTGRERKAVEEMLAESSAGIQAW